MTNDSARDYYDRCGRLEWERLTSSAYNRVELAITLHYLEKYLPPSGIVLDAGGGPGRYTIELVKRGYQVVLLDMSAVQLGIARDEVSKLAPEEQDRVIDVVQGSIVDLSQFPDGRFDAVLCLGGTLSHLVDGHARELATTELARVCRPGGSVLVSVLSFYGLLRKVLAEHPEDIEQLPMFMADRLSPKGMGISDCFFFTPEEMVDLLARKGIEVVEYVGVQGLSAQLQRVTEECFRDPERWRIWEDVLINTCNHPSVVGISDHILAVGYI
jgi:SAM-dependent methyltransferase